MKTITLRVRAIIKKDDKYLVVKHWIDDRIPDPYRWEFIDTVVLPEEAPDDAVLRGMEELLGTEGKIEHLVYTWSKLIGDTQCIGIVYICSVADEDFTLQEDYAEWEWIDRDQFPDYIDNQYILQDLEGVAL